MKPYYEAEDVTLFRGDCREVLAQLPAESVSCCMTSPPFYGLRKYTCEPSIWGGDSDCPHSLDIETRPGADRSDGGYASRKRWQHNGVSRDETPEAWVKETKKRTAGGEREYGSCDGATGRGSAPMLPESAICSLCGAWRGWLGLEPTVEMYVAHTIEWLRAVRRVLRKDGVLWLDIDDSRAGSGKGYGDPNPNLGQSRGRYPKPSRTKDIAAKNLCLIPQRIAIAAQEDGWIVRSEIIITSWMPESAKDRPTDAGRKVLMLTRSPRYWYDGQAVRQPLADSSLARISQPTLETQTGGDKQRAYEGSGNANRAADMVRSLVDNEGTKNLPNVWDDIPPAAYPDAHFATFHVSEPERCILASCPKDGTVLDPFVGTGTTAIAARKLGRRCIGIDMSEEYLQQAVTRLTVGDSGIRKMVEARRAGAEQGVLW